MTLSFSENLDGKQTLFVQKIWNSILMDPGLIDQAKLFWQYRHAHYKKFSTHWNIAAEGLWPKLHTIRKDEKNRWRAGKIIHPIINNRSKKRFQFAPEMPVRKTQNIAILDLGIETRVEIDGEHFDSWFHDPNFNCSGNRITELAKNDGFPDAWSFLKYFNFDYEGKIIHWTGLEYKPFK